MRVFVTNSDEPLEENFDEVSDKVEADFRSEKISFAEADITPGASCGALLVELKEYIPTLLPASAIALIVPGASFSSWFRTVQTWSPMESI